MARILVVDDEIEICNCMEQFLDLKGHETDIALNGIEAISKIKESRPHIILLDILMPNMNGLDALKEIKKIDPSNEVIILTAVGNEEIAKEAFKLGASKFLYKPVDFNLLEDLLWDIEIKKR